MSQEIDTKKTIALNIQLSEVEKSMLEKLKEDSGKGFGQLLRESIILRYRMRFNNEPSCSNAEACKCPNMHQVQQHSKLTDAELMQDHRGNDASS